MKKIGAILAAFAVMALVATYVLPTELHAQATDSVVVVKDTTATVTDSTAVTPTEVGPTFTGNVLAWLKASWLIWLPLVIDWLARMIPTSSNLSWTSYVIKFLKFLVANRKTDGGVHT